MPNAKLMEGHSALRGAVLEELLGCSWVHFACHGHPDIDRPFQSRFRLQDQPLNLEEIIRTDLPHAELAFLSACHTTTGDRNTPVEGQHLAAGMQFSGFCSVVGTLWAMDDQDGLSCTDTFYKYMLRNGEGEVEYKDAAIGVHKIVRFSGERRAGEGCLWTAGPTSFTSGLDAWAPF